MLCNLVFLALCVLTLLVVIFRLSFESLLEDIKGSMLGFRDVSRVCWRNSKLLHHGLDLIRSDFRRFWSRFFFATLLLLLFFLLFFFLLLCLRLLLFFFLLLLFCGLLFLFLLLFFSFFLSRAGRRFLLLLLLLGLFLFLLFCRLLFLFLFLCRAAGRRFLLLLLFLGLFLFLLFDELSEQGLGTGSSDGKWFVMIAIRVLELDSIGLAMGATAREGGQGEDTRHE